MYTAQMDGNGNVIVCKGSEVRRSYKVVFTGSYLECLAVKVKGGV